jgi:methylglutaconyl-CoA hydratase
MNERDNNSPFDTILTSVDQRGVARVSLNRPGDHNALNAQLVSEMQVFIDSLGLRGDVRALVLSGMGDSFCAGGDFRWMQSAMKKDREARMADAVPLGTMLRDLNRLPFPVIGRINGPAYGAGVGLIAVCDIAIGARTAVCRLTEVRLGLIPANVGPYVVARMGEANARRVLLTAKAMTAEDAKKFGLLSEVVEEADLDHAIERELDDLFDCAPSAVTATKRLIEYVSSHDLPESAIYVAEKLADAWETKDAEEGISAFFSERKPSWATDH